MSWFKHNMCSNLMLTTNLCSSHHSQLHFTDEGPSFREIEWCARGHSANKKQTRILNQGWLECFHNKNIFLIKSLFNSKTKMQLKTIITISTWATSHVIYKVPMKRLKIWKCLENICSKTIKKERQRDIQKERNWQTKVLCK